MEFFKVAGLYRRDIAANIEGFTMAALLLFGKDEVIMGAIPHYKVDALLRIKDLDRYDDRENIKCNLIDAYDHLMAFVAKHLPDKFYLQGDTRISLRENFFREIIANMLVHREYTNAYSGEDNIEFEEKDVFVTQVPLGNIFDDKKTDGVINDVKDDGEIDISTVPVAVPATISVQNLLKILNGEMGRSELQNKLNLSNKAYFLNDYLQPAIEQGFVAMKFPQNPNHPKQRYYLTKKAA